ncbi:hypothetical protein NQ315_005115 [Exocentrus adspersus]|uniref:Lipase domain-containing protein n=1 Tax=Exocentrus adspersus TaxID=1586481 RepID=A0AAV8VTL7_9CUCU|nr:hypothetical protein NQ315_005115 [Exocentrus adspersus]
MNTPKEFIKALSPVDYSLATAKKTDITYKLLLNPDEEKGRILINGQVAKEHLIKTAPVVIFVHGWTNDDTSPWYKSLKDEYFKLGEYNIIYTNWWRAGNKSYDVSAANTKPVGRFIAQFLLEAEVPLKTIHIVGFSLGAHVASFAGKTIFERVNKKLGRITALDPAGPRFGNPKMGPDTRISKTDADFVDVIHTDIEFNGYTRPVGHVDFYPNEGKLQNGCPPKQPGNDKEALCSHERCTLYFVESLTRKAKAKEADFEEKSNEIYVTVKENPKEVVFGFHADKTTGGVYFLETNCEPPFLKF